MQAALRRTMTTNKLEQKALGEMQRHDFLKPTETGPRVHFRLINNRPELTVRFIVRDIRQAEGALSRDTLRKFDLASATFEIVGVPPLRIAQKESPSEYYSHPWPTTVFRWARHALPILPR